MKIAIVASADALPFIQKSFESQRCVGVEFEFYADVNEILTSIETRGFYLDKLVLVTSFLQTWGMIDKQTMVNRILQICEHLQPTAEIYLADSKQLLRSEYSNLLNAYPQVKYQPQQLHVSELFGLVMGDLKQEEADNIDDSVKPKGFFGKMFSKRNKGAVAPINEDAALFPDTEPVASENPFTADAEQPTEDLYNLFEEPAQPLPEMKSFAAPVDDTPLFEDPTPVFTSAPASALITSEDESSFQASDDQSIFSSSEPQQVFQAPPQPEPEPQQFFQASPQPEPQQFFQAPPQPEPQPEQFFQAPPPAPTPAPQQQVFQAPKQGKVHTPKPAKAKSTYVDIFQKRTKIILCTGDRRTGTSTLVSNLAQQAVNDGLAVLVMDLDFERKGQAINFPFQADENDTQLAFSLFRATSAPTNLAEYVIHLEDGLDFIGTAISVSEVTNIHKAVTDDILKQMLSSALSAYDLIFIDCPFEYLREYSSLVAMAHIILHSMGTDYRAILNTLNALTPDDFENDMTYNLYLSKVMLILNNFVSHFWNSTEINEKTIISYMCTLTGEDFYRNIDVLGRVPAFPDYDRYMDAGALFVSNKSYKNIFIQLLNDIATRG